MLDDRYGLGGPYTREPYNVPIEQCKGCGRYDYVGRNYDDKEACKTSHIRYNDKMDGLRDTGWFRGGYQDLLEDVKDKG
jgi:hypothetical protein